MVLDTLSDIDQIQAVLDRAGNLRPAANADEQEAMNDRLGNRDGLTQLVYTTASTNPEPLPSNAVPHGVQVLVEFKEGNTGTVYLGDTDTQESPLTAVGQGRTFSVLNTELIHVRTPNLGDSVVVTFET